jgi:hypothetical protein
MVSNDDDDENPSSSVCHLDYILVNLYFALYGEKREARG